jgi:hypothetical protein
MIAVKGTLDNSTIANSVKVINLLVEYGAYPSALCLKKYGISTTPLIFAKTRIPNKEISEKLTSVDKIYRLTFDEVCNKLSEGSVDKKFLVNRIKDIATKAQIPIREDFGKSKSSVNTVCSCLQFMKNHRQAFDYEKVYNSRKNARKCQKNKDLTVYSEDSLSFLMEDGKFYCFEKSEVTNLLSTKKNPYTGKELPKEFLINLTKKKLVTPEPLKQSLEKLFPKPPEKLKVLEGDIIQRCIGYYSKLLQ